jgi:Fe-S-cluster containining protein
LLQIINHGKQLLDIGLEQLQQIYDNLPALDCRDCWGDCCVSPTMTASEFAFLLNHLQTAPESMVKFLTEPLKEHSSYPGNHHCRFQDNDNGRCLVYHGRALACRLHGHEAMRYWETDDMEFCLKKPGNNTSLSQEELSKKLSNLTKINEQMGIIYQEPYYFYSLNLESWLDFYFQPHLSADRPKLNVIFKQLHQQIELPTPSHYRALTTLQGKTKHH